MSNDILSKLHTTLADALFQKIKTGEATPKEMDIARQLLKDCGIQGLPVPGTPLGNLVDELPFTGED